MTLSRRLLLAPLLLAAVPGALAGCSAVITGGGDPPRLYTVNPRTGGAGAVRVQWTLEVPVPTAPQGLNTQRIALRRSAVSLEYYGGANWIDVAPEMLQTVLSRASRIPARSPAWRATRRACGPTTSW